MVFGLIILTLFAVIEASVTQKELQDIIRHVQIYDKAESQQLSNIFQELNGPFSKSDAVNSTGTGCHCIQNNCGCCLYIKVKEIGLDDTVCTNFSYLPAEYGIQFTLTFDKKTIINRTVSARNPPPICIDVPELKKLASVCLEFKDLHFTSKTFSGCIYFTARLALIKIETLKLGCFKIPPSSRSDRTLGLLSLDSSRINMTKGHEVKEYKVKGQRNMDGYQDKISKLSISP